MNAAIRPISAGLALILAAACATAQSPSPSVEQPSDTVGATPIATLAAATPIQTINPTLEPTLPVATPATPEPTPQATAAVTAAPSAPSPTAEATPQPTGLIVEWRERGGDPGFGRLYDDSTSRTFHSGAVFNNRYYIAGALEDDDYNQDRGLWSSADGLSWVRENVPNMTEVYQTAANHTGLLLLGDGFWLTTNGSDWMPIVVSDIPEQYVSSIGATPAGFVAFGSGAWTSIDGVSWAPVISQSALDLAASGVQLVASHGDRLVALTGGSGGGPLVVWSSTNLADWTRVGPLVGTRSVHEPILAGGPLGWIVAGYAEDGIRRTDLMFASVDGLSWQQVTPPNGPVSDVFVDDAGFVAVGFLHIGTGCALDPSQIQGYTWTSTDGVSWTPMPEEEFLHQRIDHLFRDGRTLIGLGLQYDEERGQASGAVWTARLPAVPPGLPGPVPAPTPEPDPGGCGPA